ncbi:hypothetical protein HK405_013768 [Cladochytrium tenue]|nr:hypothetical protein HK405_013768 [Cladochytrium tenue]
MSKRAVSSLPSPPPGPQPSSSLPPISSPLSATPLFRSRSASSVVASGVGAPAPARPGTVASLRPPMPPAVRSSDRASVAVRVMAANRADAVLVLDPADRLLGILTDADLAYRVVAPLADGPNDEDDDLAVELDLVAAGDDAEVSTKVASASRGSARDPDPAVVHIMTSNPVAVTLSSPRRAALNAMVSGRFRHLPVLADAPRTSSPLAAAAVAAESDSDAAATDPDAPDPTPVAGLLDITVCAFERLDDLERRANEDAHIASALAVLGRRGSIAAANALAASNALAGSNTTDPPAAAAAAAAAAAVAAAAAIPRAPPGCPTLARVLAAAAAPAPVAPAATVPASASVAAAARAMRDARQTAVLVVDPYPAINASSAPEDARFPDPPCGILTTKDLVLRVLAPGLDPAATPVARVMTPRPDAVTDDTSILEAMKLLRDGRYCHLPVLLGDEKLALVDVIALSISMLDYLVMLDTCNPSAS